jgi:hypothetical protein
MHYEGRAAESKLVHTPVDFESWKVSSSACVPSQLIMAGNLAVNHSRNPLIALPAEQKEKRGTCFAYWTSTDFVVGSGSDVRICNKAVESWHSERSQTQRITHTGKRTPALARGPRAAGL